MLGLVWLASFSACDAQEPDTSTPDSAVVTLHASADWYVAAEAPERPFDGVLRRRDGVVGPGSRSGLSFELVTNQATLSIYEPDEDSVLADFVDATVVVTGKLVDLTSEGFGRELWVGRIHRRP